MYIESVAGTSFSLNFGLNRAPKMIYPSMERQLNIMWTFALGLLIFYQMASKSCMYFM